MASSRICSIEGCGKRVKTRGMCSMHYERFRTKGDPLKVRTIQPGTKCSVEDCDSQVRSKGLCGKHWKRQHRYGDPLSLKKIANGEAVRFATEIAPAHDGDDCLIWPYAKGAKGRGKVDIDGISHNASRVVCRAFYGDPPSSRHHAAHRCNVPDCVNPRHLYWATPSENERDKIANGTSNRGERCGSAKLTQEDVLKIRALASSGMRFVDIAPMFNVSSSCVRIIVRRKRWAWLED